MHLYKHILFFIVFIVCANNVLTHYLWRQSAHYDPSNEVLVGMPPLDIKLTDHKISTGQNYTTLVILLKSGCEAHPTNSNLVLNNANGEVPTEGTGGQSVKKKRSHSLSSTYVVVVLLFYKKN